MTTARKLRGPASATHIWMYELEGGAIQLTRVDGRLTAVSYRDGSRSQLTEIEPSEVTALSAVASTFAQVHVMGTHDGRRFLLVLHHDKAPPFTAFFGSAPSMNERRVTSVTRHPEYGTITEVIVDVDGAPIALPIALPTARTEASLAEASRPASELFAGLHFTCL